MDTQSAKNLVKKSFESVFDYSNYNNLIKNLFGSLDYSSENSTFKLHGKYIPDAFRNYIKQYERLGKYEDNEGNQIDLLVVHLKKETSLEKARTLQRNFVAWYIKGSRGGILKDAAVVAYVSPTEEDWRFSLVKMDYHLMKSAKGKLKTKEELTPAKRFSFLVGKNEKSHTAQSRLVSLLTQEINNPSLKELEEAFSVEKVTKEFFDKYRELYFIMKESLDNLARKDNKIRKDFEGKGVDTSNFAKKLLGQIVFLYFLQKKGWFGVKRDESWGFGSKHFLRELFQKKHGDYKNFFNDILEPLFYQALRYDRSADDDYFSQFDCRIPFLNGGLFDPINDYDWVHTDILLPDKLFSNTNKTKEGDTGDGILDIFDRYNFTVKEDEPLEREVAVDPEMLGKVFENLLEVKDRKSKGTYYTPREIVHYMCQESLANYLVTESKLGEKTIRSLVNPKILTQKEYHAFRRRGGSKDKIVDGVLALWKDDAKKLYKILKGIRVCDPACGSGAFLIGMLQEIISARERLAFVLNIKSSTYELKRYAIHNSLYGVDIDPGAVEIAKLRLWLSLVVEEEEIKSIRPLPNLDYKIMQGNSLIELLSPSLLARTTDSKRNELIDELNKARNEFFNTHPPSLKKKRREEINGLTRSLLSYDREKERSSLLKKLLALKSQPKLFKEKQEQVSLAEAEKEEKLKKKIDEYNKIKESSPSDHFEWHLNFNEVFEEKGGFDVVIANPPYIGQKGNNLIFKKVKLSPLGMFHQRRMDYFYFFFHLSLNIGKQNSVISFITTNYYITATYADKLRKDLKERASMLVLGNFNELKIFESATGQHNMITILKKGVFKQPVNTFITKQTGIANSLLLTKILRKKDENTEYYSLNQEDIYYGDGDYIRLTNRPIDIALDKVANSSSNLGNICNVIQGIVTGADSITPKHIEKYGISAKLGEGIFILSENELNKLVMSEKEKAFLKPWYKNSDIFKWVTKTTTRKKLIYYTSKARIGVGKNILNHFKRYKPILINRNVRSGTGVVTESDYENFIKGKKYISYVMISSAFKQGKYYCVSYARDAFDFEGPKIIAPQRSTENTFAYNNIPWYASADVYYIFRKNLKSPFNLKYILALLNSKLYYNWLYFRGKRKGETLELYQKPLSEIPIKKIHPDKQKPFIRIVDEILKITKFKGYDPENPHKKQKELEEKIDKMVYKLYDLTPEEIAVVEGK